jgi:hypothetical protein
MLGSTLFVTNQAHPKMVKTSTFWGRAFSCMPCSAVGGESQDLHSSGCTAASTWLYATDHGTTVVQCMGGSPSKCCILGWGSCLMRCKTQMEPATSARIAAAKHSTIASRRIHSGSTLHLGTGTGEGEGGRARAERWNSPFSEARTGHLSVHPRACERAPNEWQCVMSHASRIRYITPIYGNLGDV